MSSCEILPKGSKGHHLGTLYLIKTSDITEYYLVRLSNQNPALGRELLSQVQEPEDRERYAHILDFLEQQTAR